MVLNMTLNLSSICLGLMLCLNPCEGFSFMTQYRYEVPTSGSMRVMSCNPLILTRLQLASDWYSFRALEEDDDEVFGTKIDTRKYADENDDASVKAAIGSSISVPEPLHDVDPIYVPAGSKLDLDEDTVLGLLSACRNELGTLFGYSEENRGVGITGSFEFVELDGGTVVLSLAGRYWHQRTSVLDRIANYLQQRIPEILEVTVVDPYQLTDEANNDGF